MPVGIAKVEWTGFSGAPGLTQFAFAANSDGSAAFDSIAADGAVFGAKSFITQVRPFVPNDVTMRALDEVDVYDTQSGQLVDTLSTAQGASLIGQDTGNWVAPAGAVIHWLTSSIVNGRRLRGRTFVVPGGTAQFDSTGGLADGAITTLTAAADALVLNVQTYPTSIFGVWSRGGPAKVGTFAPAGGYRIPDMAAVLRSRRD